MVGDAEVSLDERSREVADSVRITPTKEAGWKLLDKWDLRTINKDTKIREWVHAPIHCGFLLI